MLLLQENYISPYSGQGYYGQQSEYGLWNRCSQKSLVTANLDRDGTSTTERFSSSPHELFRFRDWVIENGYVTMRLSWLIRIRSSLLPEIRLIQ